MSPREPGRPVGLRFSVRVNGVEHRRRVEPRRLLSDFLRHDLGLTGTHVGCEHGVCGACTVLLDGQAVRSCLMLAVQAAGHEVLTVESLGSEAPGERDTAGDETSSLGALSPPRLHPLQTAFLDAHGLQCGFCTPGILMSVLEFLRERPDAEEPEIRDLLSGHLCRCTGYQKIVEAVLLARDSLARAAARAAAGGGEVAAE